MTGKLARFRADPVAIRVGLRRTGRKWRCVITMRADSLFLAAVERENAMDAVFHALKKADDTGLTGCIDFDMDWTYDHPWGRRECPLTKRGFHGEEDAYGGRACLYCGKPVR